MQKALSHLRRLVPNLHPGSGADTQTQISEQAHSFLLMISNFSLALRLWRKVWILEWGGLRMSSCLWSLPPLPPALWTRERQGPSRSAGGKCLRKRQGQAGLAGSCPAEGQAGHGAAAAWVPGAHDRQAGPGVWDRHLQETAGGRGEQVRARRCFRCGQGEE